MIVPPHDYDSDELYDEMYNSDCGTEQQVSHECLSCGNKQSVDDPRTTTQNWCDDCGGVRRFEKLD